METNDINQSGQRFNIENLKSTRQTHTQIITPAHWCSLNINGTGKCHLNSQWNDNNKKFPSFDGEKRVDCIHFLWYSIAVESLFPPLAMLLLKKNPNSLRNLIYAICWMLSITISCIMAKMHALTNKTLQSSRFFFFFVVDDTKHQSWNVKQTNTWMKTTTIFLWNNVGFAIYVPMYIYQKLYTVLCRWQKCVPTRIRSLRDIGKMVKWKAYVCHQIIR